MIYLDNAATSFPKDEVVYQEMDRVNRSLSVNPGRGSYRAAREANEIISSLRKELLNTFHAEDIANVVFTPSITHAINLVVSGLSFVESDVVYITPYEHNAVARSLEMMRKRIGFKVKILPLCDDLQIDIEKTKYQFSMEKPNYLFMNALSNVTGYVLPIKEIINIAKQYDSVTFIDTAQAAGLIDINMIDINADVVFFTGHKSFGGPIGIGGFLIKNGMNLNLVFAGGTGSDSLNINMPEKAPARYEASSYNVVAMAGLLAAIKCNNIPEHYKKVLSMTNLLIEELEKINNIHVLGKTPSQIGVVSFVIENYNSNDIGDILDAEYNIAVRTGYHCCPYIHKFLNDEDHAGTVRVGLGIANDKSNILELVEAIRTL